MEAPLDAREFIRRFHLPQLVRIAPSDSSPAATTSEASLNGQTASHRQADQPTGRQQSFQKQDNGGWTYAPGGQPAAAAAASSDLLFCDSSQQQIIRMPRVSLTAASNDLRPLASRRQQQQQQELHQQPARQQMGAPKKRQLQMKLTPPSNRPALNKLQLEQPFLLYKAYRKLELCAYAIDLNNELNDKSGDPIYFPHNYPGWFSIPHNTGYQNNRLDQSASGRRRDHMASSAAASTPFFTTIDQVCRSNGQVFLTRDELVGFRLPSKLSHLTKLKNNQLLAVPLAINLNKQYNTNEWLSFSANSSASSNTEQSSSSSRSKTSQASINDIRQVVIEAGQVLRICGVYEDVLPLIEAGGGGASGQAAAKPGKQQKLATSMLQQQMAPQATYQQTNFDGRVLNHRHDDHLMMGQHQNQHQHLQQHKVMMYAQQQGSNEVRRTQKLLELRYAHNNNITYQQYSQNVAGYNLIAPPLIYAPQLDQQQQQQATRLSAKQQDQEAKKKKKSAKWKNKNSSSANLLVHQNQLATGGGGQRYARCVVLNEHSIDRLTGGTNRRQLNELAEMRRLKNDPEGSEAASAAEQQEEDEELEVLIPIDQRGRFYLCATSQTIANELYNTNNNTNNTSNCQICCLAQQQHQNYPHQMHQTSSSLPMNNAHADQSHTNLVFRLSQIVYLLNLNKRLALNNQMRPAEGGGGQCRSLLSSVDLPLQLRLVVGPRPVNFSPSMFGPPSSTLDSYFSLESNVGGHSIRCRFNRNNLPADAGTIHSTAVANGATNHSPVCPCPQQLVANVHKIAASNAGERVERSLLFSGLLRFESVTKRDVLLACTIKQDPLEHLNLAGDTPQAHMSLDGHHQTPESNGTVVNKRLESLRQPQSHFASASDSISGSKSMGKSSMSRLRACRSLISRKKQRPNIPNSMMVASSNNSGSPSLPPTRSGQAKSHLDLNDILNSQQQHQPGNGPTDGQCQSIVMLEFDCNDQRLSFVRTFVEPTIPTATIPDLVLNRMEYCQSNSYQWERQLKLSNETLSQDFNAFQQQLGAASREADAQLLNKQKHCQSPIQSARLRGLDSSSSLMSNCSNKYLERRERPEVDLCSSSLAAAVHQMTSGSNNNNTTSSRSSSGVSSAGDRQQQQQHQQQQARSILTTTNDVTGGNLVEANGSSIVSSSSSSSSSSVAAMSSSDRSPSSSVLAVGQQANNPNRLLRFVHKILPTSKSFTGINIINNNNNNLKQQPQQPVAAIVKHQQQHQNKRLMEELSGRLKATGADLPNNTSSSSSAVSFQSSPRMAAASSDNVTTLMNSQKIHRRLMTGSVRHLPAYLSMEDEPEDDDDDDHHHHNEDNKQPRHDSCTSSVRHIDPKESAARGSTQKNNDDDDDDRNLFDDSSSHLYESLERLNEGLNKLKLKPRRPTTTTSNKSSAFEGSAQQPRPVRSAAATIETQPERPTLAIFDQNLHQHQHKHHHHHHHYQQQHHHQHAHADKYDHQQQLIQKQSCFDASKRRVGIGKSIEVLARLTRDDNDRENGVDHEDVDFDMDQYIYDYNAEWWRQSGGRQRADGMRDDRRPKRWDVDNKNDWKNSLASLTTTAAAAATHQRREEQRRPSAPTQNNQRLGRHYRPDNMEDMEPVSIEACEHDDEFTSIVAADEMAIEDDEQQVTPAANNGSGMHSATLLSSSAYSLSTTSSSSSSSSSLEAAKAAAATTSGSLGNLASATACNRHIEAKLAKSNSSERIYMNISALSCGNGNQPTDSITNDSEMFAQQEEGSESKRKRLVTRMERKLAKLRGRHHITARQLASMNSPTDDQEDEFNQSKSLTHQYHHDGQDDDDDDDNLERPNYSHQMRSLGWEPADELIRDSKMPLASSVAQSRLNKMHLRSAGPKSLVSLSSGRGEDGRYSVDAGKPPDGADRKELMMESSLSSRPASIRLQPTNCDNQQTSTEANNNNNNNNGNNNSLTFGSLSGGSSLRSSRSSFSSSSFVTTDRAQMKAANADAGHLSTSSCSSTPANKKPAISGPATEAYPIGGVAAAADHLRVTQGNMAEPVATGQQTAGGQANQASGEAQVDEQATTTEVATTTTFTGNSAG